MIESVGGHIYVLAFIALIGPLVFFHELGHLVAGRWFGVHAEVFSIGFGRELFGWTDRKGTRWKVGWLQLGGYVRFAGDMNPASQADPKWLSLPPEERARTFQAKPVWQRAIIVAAGPLANFLLAILIFMGVLGTVGQSRTPPVVATVAAGSAAERGGLAPGDRIMRVGGQTVDRFEEIGRVVVLHPGEPLPIELNRGGETRRLTVTPALDVERDRFGNEYRRGLLGIGSGPSEFAPVPLAELPGAAIAETRATLSMMTEGLWQIISGRRSVKELGGPLKIAQVSGQAASLGFAAFAVLAAMISINLGFINLLPVPMLDGGHLAFYAVEALKGRPVDARAQEWAFRAGLSALLLLMVFSTFNDLGSFGLWSRLAGLIG